MIDKADTGRDPIWDALKERSKSKFDSDRAQFLSQAQAGDDGGWTKHTLYHWSRTVAGQRLDYWPSRKKWQYAGRVQRGDVQQFIRKATLMIVRIHEGGVTVLMKKHDEASISDLHKFWKVSNTTKQFVEWLHFHGHADYVIAQQTFTVEDQ